VKQLLCLFALTLLIGCSAMPGSFREALRGLDMTVPSGQSDVFDPDDPGGAGAPEDGAIATPEATDENDAETPQEPPRPISKPVDANAEKRAKCERRGGTFSKTGAGLFICVNRTRDATKSCSSSTQCEGVCLARSGTCSPVDPLIGCHDIVTDNGNMARVCID